MLFCVSTQSIQYRSKGENVIKTQTVSLKTHCAFCFSIFFTWFFAASYNYLNPQCASFIFDISTRILCICLCFVQCSTLPEQTSCSCVFVSVKLRDIWHSTLLQQSWYSYILMSVKLGGVWCSTLLQQSWCSCIFVSTMLCHNLFCNQLN